MLLVVCPSPYVPRPILHFRTLFLHLFIPPRAHVVASTPRPYHSLPLSHRLRLLDSTTFELVPLFPHPLSPPPFPRASTTPWTKTTGSPAWTLSRSAPSARWRVTRSSRTWWHVPTFGPCPARTFRAWRNARKGGRRRAVVQQEGKSKEDVREKKEEGED